MGWLSFVLAAVLAIIHMLAITKTVNRIMGLKWVLSGSGGFAVAYVFVHLLPELGEHQALLEEKVNLAWLDYFEHYAYVVAMLGLILYYGVERAASAVSSGESRRSPAGVFWLHTCSFTLYNGIIGYLLVQRIQTNTIWNQLLYAVAMGLHFLVIDRGLSNHHKKIYDHFGRWILSGAILAGWAIGTWFSIPEEVFALLFAFLSGAILINVLKEELPKQKENSIVAFVAGAVIYTVLLLLSD